MCRDLVWLRLKVWNDAPVQTANRLSSHCMRGAAALGGPAGLHVSKTKDFEKRCAMAASAKGR